jgi:uncharacterized protein YjbI with pentapeptide repeats
MLGIHFDYVNPFGLEMSFENCQLNHTIFYQLKLKGTKFNSCNLYEVDFSECDLSEVSFEKCDLNGAIFEQTRLVSADFSSATNFTINPNLNNIKNAKFSLDGLPGLLIIYGIQIS